MSWSGAHSTSSELQNTWLHYQLGKLGMPVYQSGPPSPKQYSRRPFVTLMKGLLHSVVSAGLKTTEGIQRIATGGNPLLDGRTKRPNTVTGAWGKRGLWKRDCLVGNKMKENLPAAREASMRSEPGEKEPFHLPRLHTDKHTESDSHSQVYNLVAFCLSRSCAAITIIQFQHIFIIPKVSLGRLWMPY